MFLPARIDLKQRRRPPLCGLVKSGKLTVSLTCESASPGSRCFQKIWMRIQKNLDSAVNPARRPMFDSFLSHSFLLPQRNCASVGTARALLHRTDLDTIPLDFSPE